MTSEWRPVDFGQTEGALESSSRLRSLNDLAISRHKQMHWEDNETHILYFVFFEIFERKNFKY